MNLSLIITLHIHIAAFMCFWNFPLHGLLGLKVQRKIHKNGFWAHSPLDANSCIPRKDLSGAFQSSPGEGRWSSSKEEWVGGFPFLIWDGSGEEEYVCICFQKFNFICCSCIASVRCFKPFSLFSSVCLPWSLTVLLFPSIDVFLGSTISHLGEKEQDGFWWSNLSILEKFHVCFFYGNQTTGSSISSALSKKELAHQSKTCFLSWMLLKGDIVDVDNWVTNSDFIHLWRSFKGREKNCWVQKSRRKNYLNEGGTLDHSRNQKEGHEDILNYQIKTLSEKKRQSYNVVLRKTSSDIPSKPFINSSISFSSSFA